MPTDERYRNVILTLVFGVLSVMWFFPFPPLSLPLGAAAWVMGNKAIREANFEDENRCLIGLVVAGRLLGMFCVFCVSSLLLLIILGFIVSILRK